MTSTWLKVKFVAGWGTTIPRIYLFKIGLDFKLIVPCLSRKRGTLKLIRPSVTKTLTLLISSEVLMIEHSALIFGMHNHCDYPFLLVSYRDLDLKVKFVAGDHNSSNLLIQDCP